MEQAPVQIGQFILGKNLGIGAFGKVGLTRHAAGSLTSEIATRRPVQRPNPDCIPQNCMLNFYHDVT